MPFGYIDTQYIDFPPGVDAAYIEGLRTRAGVDFPRVLQEIDSRLAALNTSIDPLLAALLTTTSEISADGTAPVSFKVERAGEYTVARPQMVEGQATMLPLHKYDVALGFTEDGLESMSLPRILTNVDSLFMGYRQLYRTETLMRLFDDSELRVDDKTTSTAPGFAGSGTGNNVFSRAYPDGSALPGGYTHYYRTDTAGLAASLLAQRDRLKKWNQGPFDLVTTQAMIDLIVLINPGNPSNGFVPSDSLLVQNSPNSASASVDPTLYIGVLYGDIRVRKPITDFATNHIAMFKSFGDFAAQNPLAWRVDPLRGRNAYVRYRSMYPLDNAWLLQKFGIGTNNRVAATLTYVNASGVYVPPTWP